MERNISGGQLMPKVDCGNDPLMISLGLRARKVNIDRNVFKKDVFERKSLKAVRDRKTPSKIVVRANGVKDNSQAGKLIVYLHNNKKLKDFKTTLSFKDVKRSEVDGIIFRLSERKLPINKYYFNQ